MKSAIICVFGKRGSGKTTLADSLSRSPEYSKAIIIDPLYEYSGEQFLRGYDFLKLNKRSGPYRIIFRTARPETCDAVFGIALHLKNVLVVMEEIDLICSPNFTPFYLTDCIARGRHYGVSIICTSRRPAEVSRLLTSMATELYIFKFSEPRDLDYFRSMFGDDTRDKIQNLGEHEYIRKEL